MKLLQTTLLVTTLLTVCFQAQAVTVSPSDCDNDPNGGWNCWVASTSASNMNPGEIKITNTGNPAILNAFAPWIGGLEELYKANSNDEPSIPDDERPTPKSELGSLAGSYNTVFDWDMDDDLVGAKVTYKGGNFVDCKPDECFLLVKDGNQDPAAYLFDLALAPINWDGKMDLLLRGFWPGNGSISYLALYGNESPNPVPLPAGVWLFGTALIGLVGFGKRKKRLS